MGAFFKRHSALYRFLLLDFGIVLAMLFFSIPMYGRILNSTRQEAIRECTQRAEQAAEEINDLVFNLLGTHSSLTGEVDVGKLALLDDEIETATYYTMRSARETMKMAFFSYDDVDEAIVLYKRNQIAVSNVRVFDNRQEFYDLYIECEDLTDEELNAQIEQGFYAMKLLPSRVMTLGAEWTPKERLTLLLPMRKNSSVLCIFLNTDRVFSRFDVPQTEVGSWIQVRNGKGEIIYTQDMPQGVEKDDCLLIEQRISTLGCYVTVGIPEAYFSDLTAGERRLIVLYCALIAAMGLCLAGFIAWQSVRPVRTLVSDLKLSASKNQSEYLVIQDAFHSLNDSVGRLQQEAVRMENMLNVSRFGQLLFGSTMLGEREEEFVDMLPSVPYCIAAVQVDFSGSQEGEVVEQGLLLAQITRCLSDLGMVYPVRRSLFALLLAGGRREEFAARVSQLNREMNHPFGAYVSAGVSGLESNTHDLSHAFLQAQDNLAFVSVEQAVVLDTGAPQEPEGLVFEGLRRMYELLLGGIPEQIQRALSDMQESSGVLTSRQKKRLYYSMDLLISSVLREQNLGAEELVLPRYDESLSIQEMFGRFEEVSMALCDRLKKRKQSGNAELKQGIVDYIDQNFQNSDLYADTVAERFGLSVKYLHRLFHEYTGKSICDYIEDKRMQRARELLRGEQENVSAISEACGFRSLNTFYKAFKRVHGVSPTDYRKRLLDAQAKARE